MSTDSLIQNLFTQTVLRVGIGCFHFLRVLDADLCGESDEGGRTSSRGGELAGKLPLRDSLQWAQPFPGSQQAREWRVFSIDAGKWRQADSSSDSSQLQNIQGTTQTALSLDFCVFFFSSSVKMRKRNHGLGTHSRLPSAWEAEAGGLLGVRAQRGLEREHEGLRIGLHAV